MESMESEETVNRWTTAYLLAVSAGRYPFECPKCHCMFHVNFWKHCPACGWKYLDEMWGA